MADISDLVPTLAAVAVTASSPTTITGVGFIRAKESDRLGDLAGRAGQDRRPRRRAARRAAHRAVARASTSAVLATHHDHRLAMAFGVLGAVVPGIEVADPDVVSKSWPDFWAARTAILGPVRDSRPAGEHLPRWSAVSPADPDHEPAAIVAAFDVDGTVTTRDCVVPFLRLVGGTGRLTAGLALAAAPRRPGAGPPRP